jgi:fimbrial isopeptide formation D2 family protein/LPXTG-motif cell wall-anchored protein
MNTTTHADKATAHAAVPGTANTADTVNTATRGRATVAILVAALTAIATLLMMACMPDATLPQANADTGTSSITVVNAQKGRVYQAYRFATFSDVTASTDADSTVARLDVTTVPCTADDQNSESCWGYQLRRAYNTAKNKDSSLPDWSDNYTDNPAAFMTQLTGDQLAEMMKYFDVPSGVTADGQAENTGDLAQDITISGIPEGWYVVVDTKGGARKAVVATTITANGTPYTKFALNKGTGQSAVDALGKFYAKDLDRQNTPSKHIYTDADHTKPMAFGSFSIGDSLYYKVNTRISAHAANYDDYTFVVRDQATRGLTIDRSSLVVSSSYTQSGTQTTVPTTDYTVTVTTATDETTTMDVAINSPKAYAGKYIQLTYTATINSDAVSAGTYTTTSTNDSGVEVTSSKDIEANYLENQARVNANKEGWTEFASVVDYTGSISFTKVGVGDQENGLAGVTFKVFDGENPTESDTNKPLTFTKVSDGVYNYDPTSKNTEVVSGADGTVTLNGLRAKNDTNDRKRQYTIKETATNKSLGYAQSILATFMINHQIDTGGTVTNTLSTGKLNALGLATTDGTAIKVKNVKNFTQLPLTGAAGVALFTLMALVLGGAAAVLTVKYRRTRQQLDESLAD